MARRTWLDLQAANPDHGERFQSRHKMLRGIRIIPYAFHLRDSVLASASTRVSHGLIRPAVWAEDPKEVYSGVKGATTYEVSTRHKPLNLLYIICVYPCADHHPGHPFIPRSQDVVDGTTQAKIVVVSTRTGSYHDVVLVEIYILPYRTSVNGRDCLIFSRTK